MEELGFNDFINFKPVTSLLGTFAVLPRDSHFEQISCVFVVLHCNLPSSPKNHDGTDGTV